MSTPFSRTLKYKIPMMQGPDVRALQDAFVALGFLSHASVDGLFGPGTKRTVQAFQRENGLSADGQAGTNTFNMIRRLTGGGAAPTPQATAPISGTVIPASWMPSAHMKRIILHWTAGSHTPSALDKKHYHILIDGKGAVHRGKHSIKANENPKKGQYAAHTWKCNTKSIGVSLCAMGGDAREAPFRPGPVPITRAQVATLAKVVAELCHRYDIPISKKTVLGHGEVQTLLNVTQKAKWDPMVLPWDPSRPYREVGDAFRADAQAALDAMLNPAPEPELELDETEEVPPFSPVMLDGTRLRGASYDGRSWVDLANLVDALDWDSPAINLDDMTATIADPAVKFGIIRITDAEAFTRDWVEVAEVSERLGLKMIADDEGDLHLETVKTDAQKSIVVQRGQTLIQLARQYLGDGNRWQDFRTEEGAAFTDAMAADLKVGQVILLPDGADISAKTASPGAAIKSAAITTIAQKISRLEGQGTAMMKKRAEAVTAILKACAAEKIHDQSHQAYILATAYHETNLGQWMTEIWGPTKWQKEYGHKLGNRNDQEGRFYLGRGFVQITGRDNYAKYGKIFKKDFLEKPQQVAEFDMAAQIIVRGMAEIGFTGKGVLSDMGFDGDFDWVRARSLINGDKNHGGDSRYPGLTKGQGIAEKAQKYREIIATA